MRLHLIAVGGSAMHNIALAMSDSGYKVTGSDDQIYNPARGRLAAKGLLPEAEGWYPEKITADIDAIILGMHAKKDNPELLKAQELGLKIYSYPAFIAERSKNKKRVVIAGSHGKTSITSMVMHVLNTEKIDFDYLVGAQIDGFDNMVRLSDAPVIIIEGDEYLSSPLDLRPKFLHYSPHVTVISGIAWDHINVFPTFENYKEQFKLYVDTIQEDGLLAYYERDKHLQQIVNGKKGVKIEPYVEIPHKFLRGSNVIRIGVQNFPLNIFGEHNLQNLQAARLICKELGIEDVDFAEAMTTFEGAAKRMQLVSETKDRSIFTDFAHAPSKVKATTKAVFDQYPMRKLTACLELHTFSSLNKAFHPQYKDALKYCDKAFVYYDPKVVAKKGLEGFDEAAIRKAFNRNDILLFDDGEYLKRYLKDMNFEDMNLLMMSSGTFGGIDLKELAEYIISDYEG